MGIEVAEYLTERGREVVDAHGPIVAARIKGTRQAKPVLYANAIAVSCDVTEWDQVEALADALRRLLPEVSRVSITELGSALGVHGGPGTLLAATMPEYAPTAEAS